MSRRVAILVIRGGELPDGGAEAVAEAGGLVVVLGEGTAQAVASLTGLAVEAVALELGPFAPAAWAAALAPHLGAEEGLILPASADGRDLAPRLAHLLGRPLLAGALSVGPTGRVRLARHGGLAYEDVQVSGPFVATLLPGVAGVERPADAPPPEVRVVDLPLAAAGDPRVVEVLAADPATIDLAEAERLVAGGAGLGSAEAFALLGRVGLALGAAAGATRVATDWGWAEPQRQIGTTGVTVAPHLYVAFGISGAVQHVAGLGQPAHVVSVNTDRSCPMAALADLAVVADAPATLAALARLLDVPETDSGPPAIGEPPDGGEDTAQ